MMWFEPWVFVDKADTSKGGIEIEAAAVFVEEAALPVPPRRTMY